MANGMRPPATIENLTKFLMNILVFENTDVDEDKLSWQNCSSNGMVMIISEKKNKISNNKDNDSKTIQSEKLK